MTTMVLRPEVVILASRFDFTSDHVAVELNRLGASYLRLNVEDLPLGSVTLDPLTPRMFGQVGECKFELESSTLRSIYFRQPVFHRIASTHSAAPHDAFTREQWASFVRSFLVFERCHWMNHPAATYVAEHKAIQLSKAAQLGLDVPRTFITNTPEAAALLPGNEAAVVVKGLDTVYVRDGASERFGYTQVVPVAMLSCENLGAAPAIVQELLAPKTDLRVTVLGEDIWCAEITQGGAPIAGDWRLHKDSLTYRRVELPPRVAAQCADLVRALGLTFGAIDLALVDERYIFLEVNPTGEWAWLASGLEFPIARSIAKRLVSAPAWTSSA